MLSSIKPTRVLLSLILLVLLLFQAPLPGTCHSDRREESHLGTTEILPCGQDDVLAGARFLLYRVASRFTRPPKVSAAASIQAQVYTDRAAFDAALDGVANIPFEGFATEGGQANAAELDGDEFPSLTLAAGSGTSGLFVGIPDQSIPGGNDQNFFAGDFVPTSGEALLATDLTGYANGAIIVDFDTPTGGVGASFMDVEAQVSYIEVFDGLGGMGNSLGKGTLTNQGNVSQSFVGVTAPGIRSAVLQIGGSNDGVGLDDLRYGSPGSVVDDEAPAAVTDLAARPGAQPGTIVLSWTATGDDGHSGTAASYIIRHNSKPITESNWATSEDVENERTPSVAGSAESLTLSGLAEGQNYHFAIKVSDDVPLTSDISNSPQTAPALTPKLSSAVTGMDGKATLTIDGQAITFEPFDPELPGLPLPHIQITAKEYTTHTILLWEDTAGDRPPPYYRPALDFLAKPLGFSEDRRPMQPEPQPSYPVYVPYVIKNSTPAQVTAIASVAASTSAAEQPEGWDITEARIVPNTITAYEGPDATIDGSDFADHMIEHYPGAKAFVFYHHDAVPSMDDAELEIYETVDERVIAVNIRLKGTAPSDHAQAVATEVIWHAVFDKIALHNLNLVAAPVTAITEESFKHYNSQCIPVPDVTGRDRSEARALLQQMGFSVKDVETYSAFPLDEVIDQNRGPDVTFSKCALPGAMVTIEISLGPKPVQYKLHSIRVSTSNHRPRTLFEPGDPVWLTIDGVNHSSESLAVVYSWQTTGPDGEQVAGLSESSRVVQVPKGERSTETLEGVAPNLCGEYTFVGTAAFTPSGGARKYLKRQAYFQVAGGGCIPPVTNRAPHVPSNPSPVDGATNQALSLTLSWTGGDPDFDKVTYDIFWGKSNPPATQIAFSQSKTTKATGPIKTNTTYYWQVVAKDEEGKTTEGPVWSFTTGPGGSPPPGGMVSVPAGVFQMGCDQTNPAESCQPGQELHSVSLDAYYIDKYEVTNAEYAQCVNAGACDPPAQNTSATRPVYYGSSLFAGYSVVHVSWYQASDYCTWAGGRLPTEAEWEKAARGSADTRAFPWGNDDPVCSRLNYTVGDTAGPCEGDTSQVGDYPTGQSPYGILDMAGNVYEWVSDWYDGDYYANSPYYNPQGPASGSSKIVRGGSWSSTRLYVRVARRISNNPAWESHYIGFRCARTP